MDVSKLNMEFLNKAEKITQFNIPASDFTNLTYKKEIQYLFKKHFFPSFNLDKRFFWIVNLPFPFAS